MAFLLMWPLARLFGGDCELFGCNLFIKLCCPVLLSKDMHRRARQQRISSPINDQVAILIGLFHHKEVPVGLMGLREPARAWAGSARAQP